MLAWDRGLKKILATQKKTEPKTVLPKKRKREKLKKVLPNNKIGEDSDTMTYEEYLKLHNLRDFTKKNNFIALSILVGPKLLFNLKG